MARGTYISENLTQPQIEMMLMLDEYQMDIFTLQELEELSPCCNQSRSYRILKNTADFSLGLGYMVKRSADAYCFRQDQSYKVLP